MRIRLRPLRPLEEDLEEVTRRPMPVWLVRYYEVHSFGFADRPTADRMPVSVRLAAIGQVVRHRLTLTIDVVRRLEALGWTATVEDGHLVASIDGDDQEGWARLRRAGVADQLLLLLDPDDVARVPGPTSERPPPGPWPGTVPEAP